MKAKYLLVSLAMMAGVSAMGQTLEKMNWFNEPAQWRIDGDRLTMDVTPKSD